MTHAQGADTLEPGAVNVPPRDQARGRPARPGHGHPWLTLVAVALGVMMVGLDATVVSIANPAIAKDLGASLSGLQWVTNAYLLALAVTLIPAGKIADRFGRKRTFLAGVVGFAVSSLLIGLSGGLGMVIFWRVVQGFAGALLQPASLAILRNTFPPSGSTPRSASGAPRSASRSRAARSSPGCWSRTSTGSRCSSSTPRSGWSRCWSACG